MTGIVHRCRLVQQIDWFVVTAVLLGRAPYSIENKRRDSDDVLFVLGFGDLLTEQ